MPAYGHCHNADIDAGPAECFAALTDYERLPEWQRAVRSARVLERDAKGRGSVVEYEVDARFALNTVTTDGVRFDRRVTAVRLDPAGAGRPGASGRPVMS